MIKYNVEWVKEWDKPKLKKNIVNGIIDIPFFIIENWKSLSVVMFSMVAWLYYLNSLTARTDIFSGNMFYLVIAILLPLIFGLGVKQGYICNKNEGCFSK